MARLSAFLCRAIHSNAGHGGLLGIKELGHPLGFDMLADRVIAKCYRLVDNILDAGGLADKTHIVEKIDSISDNICSVIDLAELLRRNDPRKGFRQAAEHATLKMSPFMHELNTNTRLYQALKCALGNAAASASWNAEAHMVAHSFIHDFELAGINLSPNVREKYVTLQLDISKLGYAFECTAGSQEERLALLNELIQKRYLLARTIGYASYARMFLKNKILNSPEAVQLFILEQIKTRNDFEDVDKIDDSLTYSLEKILAGLATFYSKAFGIKILQADTPHDQETWHETVRAYDCVSDTVGYLGRIYCDLSSRTGKSNDPAHYTLRCRRQTSQPNFVYQTDLGHHQSPIVAISLGVESGEQCTWSEAESIFHEMGHAMHSIMSQTRFHNLSGTRCSLDFVEIPSILMELAFRDCRIQELLEPISKGHSTKAVPLVHKKDNVRQLFLALLDQRLHGDISQQANGRKGSTKVCQILQSTIEEFASLSGSADLGFRPESFGHISGYGAGYYSYLFSRTIARKIWKRFFAADPFNRMCGDRYWKSVLWFGGAKDPIDIFKELEIGL